VKSPVIQALISSSLHEQERREHALRSIVAAKLDVPAPEGDLSGWPLFKSWCEQRQITPYPARPAAVAAFILENAALGIDELLRIVKSISVVHERVADPTASGAVPAALNKIAPIQPPRSWPKAERQMLLRLPYDLQKYWHSRADEVDRVVRRSQNEAGQLRRTFSDLQEYFCLGLTPSNIEVTDGIDTHASA
jgi:hypothetical protein